MTAHELIALFRRMLDESWRYVWGAAETGKVDCSGAFVWAYRQIGLSVYHGSNRMARVETPELLPISAARPGMIAYKAREPTEKGYALPDGYKPGGKHYNGDLHDYYHVGLVDDDPRYVLNAQSERTGFVRSKITDGWDAVGYARKIEYTDKSKEEEVIPMQTAVVTAQSGQTVNLRKTPGGDLTDRVPVGATVTVEESGGEWSRVEYGGKSGWMMSRFLDTADASEEIRLEDRISGLERSVKMLSDRVLTLEGGVG